MVEKVGPPRVPLEVHSSNLTGCVHTDSTFGKTEPDCLPEIITNPIIVNFSHGGGRALLNCTYTHHVHIVHNHIYTPC